MATKNVGKIATLRGGELIQACDGAGVYCSSTASQRTEQYNCGPSLPRCISQCWVLKHVLRQFSFQNPNLFYLENSKLTLVLPHYTNCKLGTTLRIVLCQSTRYCTLALTDKTEYEIENVKLVSDDLKTAVLTST